MSYNERINIGHGTFTPLVILANGGMSRGCQTFYTKLSEKIPEKACQSNSVFSSCIVDLVKKNSVMKSICICLHETVV